MTPRDLRNIHFTGNSCRDALPYANIALKLPRYFYLLVEKPLGRYFQVRSPYYQVAQCNQKTPIPVCSRWQVRFWSATGFENCHRFWKFSRVAHGFLGCQFLDFSFCPVFNASKKLQSVLQQLNMLFLNTLPGALSEQI